MGERGTEAPVTVADINLVEQLDSYARAEPAGIGRGESATALCSDTVTHQKVIISANKTA
jgi:hypothetical protein